MSVPVLPRYGAATLSDLIPSVAARLGHPGSTDVLGLGESDRFVVLLVDGLGWNLLRAAREAAPTLTAMAGRPISSGVPSTTATSITSLGTGLTPGQHGVAGYTFRYAGELLNALLWRAGVDGLDVQPQLTYLERLAKGGVSVSSVTPARFRSSGLTTCALRGPVFLDVADEGDSAAKVALAVQGAGQGDRSLTYVYERELDHTGHAHGVASGQWLAALTKVDDFVAQLRAALPDDTTLLVTGDHGMIDVPLSARLVIEEEPELAAGLAMIGGEPRLRQLYVRPGQAAAIAQRWTDRLGEGAWVRTRDQAIDEGWFGPTLPRLADRFGDVLVACRDDAALMTHSQPKEFTLVGMHGSLTDDELTVPLLIG